MRGLNFLLTLLGILILIAASALAITGAVYPAIFLSIGDFVSGPLVYVVEGATGRAAALLIGVGILLALFYLGWGNWQAVRRERTVVLQNPLGEVLVSLPAVEDFGRILKGKIEGLKDIKGRVIYTRRGLKVSARITIYSDCSIAEVTGHVQEEIRNYIQKTLNIEQEINPTVVVHKVFPREKTAPAPGIKTTSYTTRGGVEFPPRL